MRPLRLFAQNYGPYEDVSWIVEAGVTAVVGRNDGEGINSNGAGKSKLLEIIPTALFGPSSALARHLTTGSVATTCEVGLEFEHAGDQYRIVRTFIAKGRGASAVAFERRTLDGGWEPLARESQAETQVAIEQLLGIGEMTFQQSVFSHQFARHFADPDIPPRERKEILAEALELGVYDRLLEASRREAASVDAQLTALAGALATWEETLSRRPVVEQELVTFRGQIADLELLEQTEGAQHATLQNAYEQARAARGHVDSARQIVAARSLTLDGYQSKLTAAADATVMIEALQDQLAVAQATASDVARLDTQVQEMQLAARARAERQRQYTGLHDNRAHEERAAAALVEKAAQMATRAAAILARIESPADLCDRCGQPVAGAAREALLASLQLDLDALNGENGRLLEEAQAHTERAAQLAAEATALDVIEPTDDAAHLEMTLAALQSARTAQAQAEGLRARLAAAESARDAVSSPTFIADHAAALAALQGAQADLERAEANVVSEERANELARDTLGAKVRLEQAQQQLGEARRTLGGAEERMRAVERAAEQAADGLQGRARLQARADVLAQLVRAYSRDGIPALIMESTAIPQLEREAQRILEALGVPYRIELRTQAQQKTTDRLKDTLDVVIHEPAGERLYETFSGGERARINVALRIALARLLTHRRGAQMEMFALDEVEHLDAAGVAKLAELLHDLQREIPVVLFISHVETLTEAFDQTVTVVREGDRSRLELAA